MGTSASSRDLVRKLDQTAKRIERSRRRAITAAGAAAAEAMEAEAGRAGLRAGSSKLAGRTWRGMRSTPRGDDTAVVRTLGPAWLHDSDTVAHRQVPKRGTLTKTGRVRRGGRQAMYFPGAAHPFRSALHPGTTGKRWSKKGKARAEKDSPEAYAAEMRRQVREAFR